MSDEPSSTRVAGRHSASRDRGSSSTHYKMDNPRRGVAAIFNQQHFDNCVFSQRVGSEKDVDSLRNSFGRLGFQVEIFSDLTFVEISTTLAALCKRDHSKCDCFVLVFMSHGLEGKLRAKDVIFDVNCLWTCFSPEHAPSLVNKPKIFIIQACQGHKKQSGVKVNDEGSDRTQDQITLVPGYVLPSSPDFLVALSTIPGFVSWRSSLKGSWYIQSICNHLDSHGFEQDLITLFTHVGRQIAIEYYVLDHRPNFIKKQLPSIISFLVKKVLFTRKGGVCGNKRKRDSIEDDVDTINENRRKTRRET